MIGSTQKIRHTLICRIFSAFLSFVFTFGVVLPPYIAQAQILPTLPLPGAMVVQSPGYFPVLIKGITIHPENPLEFDFIIDTGDSGIAVKSQQFKDESLRLVKYFLASLTVPAEEMWVNLSPYEQDRVIPEAFGKTGMGMDLLAQDYMLKQLTASLIYPEEGLGKKFWDRVYERSAKEFGTTNIPIDSFHKVWIVPEDALVYEKGNQAFVIRNKLKVMMEEDYIALRAAHGAEATVTGNAQSDKSNQLSELQTEVMREVILPEIEKEVNEGENFAQLRQVFQSMVLATWFKKNFKESLLGQVYADQNKVKGVDTNDPAMKEKIYKQYVQAFEKGVYNYIKEDYDPVTKEIIPRNYFSGGVYGPAMTAAQKSVKAGSPEARALGREIPNALKARGEEDGSVVVDLTENEQEADVRQAQAADQVMATTPDDKKRPDLRDLLNIRSQTVEKALDVLEQLKGELDSHTALQGEVASLHTSLDNHNKALSEVIAQLVELRNGSEVGKLPTGTKDKVIGLIDSVVGDQAVLVDPEEFYLERDDLYNLETRQDFRVKRRDNNAQVGRLAIRSGDDGRTRIILVGEKEFATFVSGQQYLSEEEALALLNQAYEAKQSKGESTDQAMTVTIGIKQYSWPRQFPVIAFNQTKVLAQNEKYLIAQLIPNKPNGSPYIVFFNKKTQEIATEIQGLEEDSAIFTGEKGRKFRRNLTILEKYFDQNGNLKNGTPQEAFNTAVGKVVASIPQLIEEIEEKPVMHDIQLLITNLRKRGLQNGPGTDRQKMYQRIADKMRDVLVTEAPALPEAEIASEDTQSPETTTQLSPEDEAAAALERMAGGDLAMLTLTHDAQIKLAQSAPTAWRNVSNGVISDPKQLEAIETLVKTDNMHVFKNWDEPGINDDRKREVLQSLVEVEEVGDDLPAYLEDLRRKLRDAAEGVSAFEGYELDNPRHRETDIRDLSWDSSEIKELLEAADPKLNRIAAFSPVGGKGQRLGYKGIKGGIPIDTVSSRTYLKHFLKTIKAMQDFGNRINNEERKNRVFLMTSKDNHDDTVAFLKANDFFGLDGVTEIRNDEDVEFLKNGNFKQIVLIPQGLVPSVVDNDAHLALKEGKDEDGYGLELNPHGHGDLNYLAYKYGVAEAFLAEGAEFGLFFQDTNAQSMNAMPVLIGTLIRDDVDFAEGASEKEVGEAAGIYAWMKATDEAKASGKRDWVGNVEYGAELDALLHASGYDQEPLDPAMDPEKKISLFRAHLQVRAAKLAAYVETVNTHQGDFGSFVNPKYVDESNKKNSAFKKEVRRERMLQDKLKTVDPDRVAIVVFNKRDIFSPVKNSLEEALMKVAGKKSSDSMPAAEGHFYQWMRKLASIAGADINVQGEKRFAFGGKYWVFTIQAEDGTKRTIVALKEDDEDGTVPLWTLIDEWKRIPLKGEVEDFLDEGEKIIDRKTIDGIPYWYGARIVVDNVATPAQVIEMFQGMEGRIDDNAVIHVEAENPSTISLAGIEQVKGTLIIKARADQSLHFEQGFKVDNEGWQQEPLTRDDFGSESKVVQEIRLRGYSDIVSQEKVIDITAMDAGNYYVGADGRVQRTGDDSAMVVPVVKMDQGVVDLAKNIRRTGWGHNPEGYGYIASDVDGNRQAPRYGQHMYQQITKINGFLKRVFGEDYSHFTDDVIIAVDGVGGQTTSVIQADGLVVKHPNRKLVVLDSLGTDYRQLAEDWLSALRANPKTKLLWVVGSKSGQTDETMTNFQETLRTLIEVFGRFKFGNEQGKAIATELIGKLWNVKEFRELATMTTASLNLTPQQKEILQEVFKNAIFATGTWDATKGSGSRLDRMVKEGFLKDLFDRSEDQVVLLEMLPNLDGHFQGISPNSVAINALLGLDIQEILLGGLEEAKKQRDREDHTPRVLAEHIVRNNMHQMVIGIPDSRFLRLAEAIGQTVPESTGKGRQHGFEFGLKTFKYQRGRINDAFRFHPRNKFYFIIDVAGEKSIELDPEIEKNNFVYRFRMNGINEWELGRIIQFVEVLAVQIGSLYVAQALKAAQGFGAGETIDLTDPKSIQKIMTGVEGKGRLAKSFNALHDIYDDITPFRQPGVEMAKKLVKEGAGVRMFNKEGTMENGLPVRDPGQRAQYYREREKLVENGSVLDVSKLGLYDGDSYLIGDAANEFLAQLVSQLQGVDHLSEVQKQVLALRIHAHSQGKPLNVGIYAPRNSETEKLKAALEAMGVDRVDFLPAEQHKSRQHDVQGAEPGVELIIESVVTAEKAAQATKLVADGMVPVYLHGLTAAEESDLYADVYPGVFHEVGTQTAKILVKDLTVAANRDELLDDFEGVMQVPDAVILTIPVATIVSHITTLESEGEVFKKEMVVQEARMLGKNTRIMVFEGVFHLLVSEYDSKMDVTTHKMILPRGNMTLRFWEEPGKHIDLPEAGSKFTVYTEAPGRKGGDGETGQKGDKGPDNAILTLKSDPALAERLKGDEDFNTIARDLTQKGFRHIDSSLKVADYLRRGEVEGEILLSNGQSFKAGEVARLLPQGNWTTLRMLLNEEAGVAVLYDVGNNLDLDKASELDRAMVTRVMKDQEIDGNLNFLSGVKFGPGRTMPYLMLSGGNGATIVARGERFKSNVTQVLGTFSGRGTWGESFYNISYDKILEYITNVIGIDGRYSEQVAAMLTKSQISADLKGLERKSLAEIGAVNNIEELENVSVTDFLVDPDIESSYDRYHALKEAMQGEAIWDVLGLTREVYNNDDLLGRMDLNALTEEAKWFQSLAPWRRDQIRAFFGEDGMQHVIPFDQGYGDFRKGGIANIPQELFTLDDANLILAAGMADYVKTMLIHPERMLGRRDAEGQWHHLGSLKDVSAEDLASYGAIELHPNLPQGEDRAWILKWEGNKTPSGRDRTQFGERPTNQGEELNISMEDIANIPGVIGLKFMTYVDAKDPLGFGKIAEEISRLGVEAHENKLLFFPEPLPFKKAGGKWTGAKLAKAAGEENAPLAFEEGTLQGQYEFAKWQADGVLLFVAAMAYASQKADFFDALKIAFPGTLDMYEDGQQAEDTGYAEDSTQDGDKAMLTLDEDAVSLVKSEMATAGFPNGSEYVVQHLQGEIAFSTMLKHVLEDNGMEIHDAEFYHAAVLEKITDLKDVLEISEEVAASATQVDSAMVGQAAEQAIDQARVQEVARQEGLSWANDEDTVDKVTSLLNIGMNYKYEYVEPLAAFENAVEEIMSIAEFPSYQAALEFALKFVSDSAIREAVTTAEGKKFDSRSPSKQEARAQKSKTGGIDLNPELLDLKIKRDGKGVPLPMPMQSIEQLMKIEGFLPVIINVTPIQNLPMMLGFDVDGDSEDDGNRLTELDAADKVAKLDY